MDDYGANNDLSTKIDDYLELLDNMALEGDQWALKMTHILTVGRTGFCRTIIIAGENEDALRRTLKAFPGFTYIELRELARKMHTRYMLERLM